MAMPRERNTIIRMVVPATKSGVSAMTEEMNVGIENPFVMVRDMPIPRSGAISIIYRITPSPLRLIKLLMVGSALFRISNAEIFSPERRSLLRITLAFRSMAT